MKLIEMAVPLPSAISTVAPAFSFAETNRKCQLTQTKWISADFRSTMFLKFSTFAEKPLFGENKECGFRPPSGVFQKAAYEFVPEAIGSEIGWIDLVWMVSILRIGLDWRQRRLSAGFRESS